MFINFGPRRYKGGHEIEISKRIPADIRMNEKTFLNDKKIDASLYGLLQSFSVGIKDGDKAYTFVDKKNMPTQNKICKLVGVKSAKTFRNRLNYLIEKGYVQELESGDYILPEIENSFLMIPLDTLQALVYTVQEHVLKTYIYLGQKWRLGNKSFTLEELCAHIGININNNMQHYDMINATLQLLEKLELIKYETVKTGEGFKTQKVLTNFSFKTNIKLKK